MDRDTFKFNEHFIDKSEEILKWKHPFSCIVAGPSRSGKTSFVLKLIKNAGPTLPHLIRVNTTTI